MQTINFSVNIDDGEGGGVANVNIMMVNRSNIDLQYNITLDAMAIKQPLWNTAIMMFI